MSRYARKVDGNHAEIVRALALADAMVQSIASVGAGCPDLLVGYKGRWVVMEIKDGSKPPGARRLAECQRIWHLTAKRHGLPVFVVTSPQEALDALK